MLTRYRRADLPVLLATLSVALGSLGAAAPIEGAPIEGARAEGTLAEGRLAEGTPAEGALAEGAAEAPVRETAAVMTSVGGAGIRQADLAQLVAALGADDLEVREVAQQELAGRLLNLESGAALVPMLEGKTPGVRRRLSLLLGADDRLLRHAVELAVASNAEYADVGRQAIDAQLLRWSRSAFDEPSVASFDVPRQPTRFPAAWEEQTGVRVAVDPNAGGGLGAFDRLDLHGRGPAPVILDPQVVERMIRRPAPRLEAFRVDGSWTEVLEGLATVHEAAYQVQGFRYPEDRGEGEGAASEAPARAWIHVVGRGSTERAPVGRDLRASGGSIIERWCVTAAREGNVVRQSAAARALAGLDWAAAVHWFEDWWHATGDVVALEGLMAAAARGRVAPSLQREASVRSVLAFIDRESREVAALQRAVAVAGDAESEAEARALFEESRDALDRRSARLACGLAALAPITAGEVGVPAGAPMIPLFIEGFEGAPPTGRWARLVALEGFGLADQAAAAFAVRVLKGELDARSRRQALRALLVLKPLGARRRIELSDPGALLRESPGGDIAGLGLELGLAGVRPRTSWTWAAGAAPDSATAAELLVWAALAAEEDGARGPCPAWISATVRASLRLEVERRQQDQPGPLELASRMVRGDLMRAFGPLAARVAEALSPEERVALRSVSLRAGLASPAVLRLALDEAMATLEGPRDQPEAIGEAWMDLAAMVGDPGVGALALETLEASLSEALEGRSRGAVGTSTALRQAAEAACMTLDRARRDDLSERFSGELRRVATMGSHPLADLFLGEAWPPSRLLPPRDLEQLSAPLPPR